MTDTTAHPPARLAPDGRVAVRIPETVDTNKGPVNWICTSFDVLWRMEFLTDAEVADWTPLVPDPTRDRVTCPWCSRPDRKLTPQGHIRRHIAKPGSEPWAPPCGGSGRRPGDYEAANGGPR